MLKRSVCPLRLPYVHRFEKFIALVDERALDFHVLEYPSLLDLVRQDYAYRDSVDHRGGSTVGVEVHVWLHHVPSNGAPCLPFFYIPMLISFVVK